MKNKINIFCLAYLLIWSLVPAIGEMLSGVVYKLIFGIFTIIWLTTGMKELNNYSALTKAFLTRPAACFMVLMLLYYVIGYGDLNIFGFVNYILLFGYCINGVTYGLRQDKKTDSFICILSIVLLTTTSITTVMQLLSNPDACRILTSSSEDGVIQHILRMLNVGSFDFIYALAILTPLTIAFVVRSRYSKKIKIVVLIISLLFCCTLLLSNFTTAIILLFMGVFISVITMQKDITTGRLIAFGVISAIIAPLLLKYFLLFMEDNTDSIYAKSKFEGLVGLLDGGGIESVNNATSRTALMSRSVGSFFSNPIFGAGAFYQVSSSSPIGQHSQLIDELARYGLLGFPFILIFIVRTIKVHLRRNTVKTINNPYFAAVLLFAFLSVNNPVFNYCIMAITFVVTPALSRIILNKYGNIISY